MIKQALLLLSAVSVVAVPSAASARHRDHHNGRHYSRPLL